MTDNTEILLARIDERTRNIDNKLKEVDKEIKDVRSKIDKETASIRSELKDNYIDKNQFIPIQRAVFTAIFAIVMGVGAAVLNLVLPGR